MAGKKQKISSADYYELYEQMKKEPATFREQVCSILDISEDTFYYKNRNKSWNYAEQCVISKIWGIDRIILFPETEEKVA